MGTTELAGYPYGDTGVDDPDGPNQFAELGRAVETDVMLTFASDDARDTRITNPVADQMARVVIDGVSRLTIYDVDLGQWKDYGHKNPPPAVWIPLPLNNGWRQWEAGWPVAAYTKDELGWVHLRSVVGRSGPSLSTGAGSDICNLPRAYWPSDLSAHYFVGEAPGVNCRIDVYGTGGGIYVLDAVAQGWWVYLDQIRYYAGTGA